MRESLAQQRRVEQPQRPGRHLPRRLQAVRAQGITPPGEHACSACRAGQDSWHNSPPVRPWSPASVGRGPAGQQLTRPATVTRHRPGRRAALVERLLRGAPAHHRRRPSSPTTRADRRVGCPSASPSSVRRWTPTDATPRTPARCKTAPRPGRHERPSRSLPDGSAQGIVRVADHASCGWAGWKACGHHRSFPSAYSGCRTGYR